MKQSAAKTLGVAALGAAFAAVGAGAANAAPAVPDAPALDTVTQTLQNSPVNGATTLPAGSPDVLAQGQDALGGGLSAAQPAAAGALSDGPAVPATGLLGGLPAKGLPVNGVPLG
ncbi:ATP-binding protein [Streptomyces sporangiiformans]|uniref:ATP-binding protein n=1 Tax=Streptomyces sporangiiformans TaxID=2315329 RepID=A0A505DLM7_9ACTN|nr:ATP-binding protein [Streptomyces sporangiiformans]TPQ20559.1 ATP-binding protein [Streptomyces sporangiiformans]